MYILGLASFFKNYSTVINASHCAGRSRSINTSVSLLLLSALVSSPINAAQLEEVVVTATMRSESLQDVPVSVNAVGGEKLFEAGIDRIEDLAAYVPNLTMSETAIGTNIYIRGIGSGINQGFEQSVGMYFDGVSYGRAQLSRSPFMDLARVEVLRGPQNILQGKNSIAGSLNLISAKPGQEFEALVSVVHEPSHGEEVYDFMVSTPVSDTFGLRASARVKRLDGYMENLTLNRNEPNRDEMTLRLVLDWTLGDNTSVMFKTEQSIFDGTGRQIEIVNDRPSVRPVTPGAQGDDFNGRTYAEMLDETNLVIGGVVIGGQPVGAVVIQIDEDSSVLNNYQDLKRSNNGDFSNNKVGAHILKIQSRVNDHEFTSISAFLNYEFTETCDCDFTGGNLFKLDLAEDYEQYSQEFRWISPPAENFEFIGGLYLHKSSLTFKDGFYIDRSWTAIPELLNALDYSDALAALQAGNLEGLGGRGSFPPGDAGDIVAGLHAKRDFTTEAFLASTFLQTTWHIADTLRLTFGGRYSYEEKEGGRYFDFFDLDTGQRRPEGELDVITSRTFLSERHDLSGERTEDFFSPILTVQWEATDESMVYATLTRGFKSGGYDARSNSSPSPDDAIKDHDNNPLTPDLNTRNIVGSFEFDREVANSFEMGAKNTLFDSVMELNVAFFYTEYTDLQVSVFDGTLGFNVGNAGEARTMGIELDGRAALSENLLISFSMAWLDFEFTDYENGQCYQDRVNAGRGYSNNAPLPDSYVDGVPFCDFKGKTNQYAADISGNLGFVYSLELGRSWEMRSGLDFVFTTAYNPTPNLDPSMEQDGYVKVNGRLGFAHIDRGWDIALVAKNLTDERTIGYASDTPLANSNLGTVGHYAFADRSRSVGIQISKRWR
jgi:iron complex outermembrane receptor protein